MNDLQHKFDIYQELLIKWQNTINLVSGNTLNDIQARHIIDSEQLVKYIGGNVKLLTDIGSGAGFPALIIAMCRPDIQVSCVEADERKCTFLKTVSRETSTPINIINDRIENVCNEAYRCDLITARACASLSSILNMTHSTGAEYLLLKGKNYNNELKEASGNYNYDAHTYPSITDGGAKIIHLKGVSKMP